MKETLHRVVGEAPLVQEVDVDGDAELRARFGEEVPVLYINGRKAFKFRVSPRELRAKIREASRRS